MQSVVNLVDKGAYIEKKSIGIYYKHSVALILADKKFKSKSQSKKNTRTGRLSIT